MSTPCCQLWRRGTSCVYAVSSRLRERTIVTVQYVRPRRRRFLASPAEPLRQLKLRAGISHSSCQRPAKAVRLFPTELQPLIMQKGALLPTGSNTVAQKPDIMDLTWFSDVTLFHLSTQKIRVCCAYPHATHEESFNLQKMGVKCVLSGWPKFLQHNRQH
jgi:hypothetical protein